MDELFAMDAKAGEQGFDHAARRELRLQRAKPLVEVIRAEVEAARSASLPSSALGKAVHYTLSLWRKLTRFLEHPELELSNNVAEKLDAARGAGPQELDPRWEPAGRAEGDGDPVHRGKLPEDEIPNPGILADVMPGLAETSVQRVAEITPAAWAAVGR